MKLHDEIPRELDDRPGIGRPAWNFTQFGSILDVLCLNSNNHQNLWNLLMLVKMIVIWLIKHEIRRNVGGKIHRN